MSGGGGGGGGGDGSDAIIRQNNERARQQYEYDKNVYDFQWEGSVDNPEGQHWRRFNYDLAGYEIQKQNDTIAREYKDEAARKQWEHGLTINDYQHEQNMRMYRKSEDQFGRGQQFNQAALEAGLERQDQVLNEQFIDLAFQNQSIIQDLYEATGSAGFDQVQTQLGLKRMEGDLEYQELMKLTNLKQGVETSQFDAAGTQLGMVDASGQAQYRVAGTELEMLDKLGEADYTVAGKKLEMIDRTGGTAYAKEGIKQDLYAKQVQNKFDLVATDLNVREAKSAEQYERDILMRNLADSRAKASYGIQQQYVEALQKSGQAALTQSGRSQGKAIQMVFAELGRQQNYLVESLVSGKAAADVKAKHAAVNTLNVQARAKLSEAKIDFDSLDALTRAEMQLGEAERSLKIGTTAAGLDITEAERALKTGLSRGELDIGETKRALGTELTKGELDLDQITTEVGHAIDTTAIDVKDIERQLTNAESQAAFDLEKINWETENLGSRFKQNQDILRASLDSAVASASLDRRDLALAKYQSDLQIEAARMLRPEEQPYIDAPELLPEVIYQDPLAPEKPPAPIMGALMQQSSSSSFASTGARVLGSAVTGLSAYGAATTIGGAIGGVAGPIGAAVAIGSYLFS